MNNFSLTLFAAKFYSILSKSISFFFNNFSLFLSLSSSFTNFSTCQFSLSSFINILIFYFFDVLDDRFILFCISFFVLYNIDLNSKFIFHESWQLNSIESLNIKFIFVETTFDVMKNNVSLLALIQKLFKIVNNDKSSFSAITRNEYTIFENHKIMFRCSDNEKDDKIILSILINVNNRNFYLWNDEIASDKTF